MTSKQALDFAEALWKLAKVKPERPFANFFEYAEATVEVWKHHLSKYQKKKLEDQAGSWAEAWARLYDEFDKQVRADPMLIYQPINKASAAFHQSVAFIRYFRGGNRTSKTQSGYAEDYYYATSQHPYRDIPYPSAITIIAGLPFTDYAPRVFEKKLKDGEPDNILSPMFPEGGKWFNHYDPRQRILTLGCPECAAKFKAGSCKHEKSTITLVSSEKGVGVLEAFSSRLIHIDEHVGEEFFTASVQRLKGQRQAGLIVTGTPFHGPEAWEARLLAKLAEGPPDANRVDPENPKSDPFVSLHQVSQWEGNVATHEEIRRDMRLYNKFEIAARVYGIPTPLAENPVFDGFALEKMSEVATDPIYGSLEPTVPLEELTRGSQLDFLKQDSEKPDEYSGWRIWELPSPEGQYIMGVDTGAGLATGDASCASILKMVRLETQEIKYEMVAQYHGRLNPHYYAAEVFKGCIYYNTAICVVELTGGYGRAVMTRLANDWCYWNIYRSGKAQKAERIEHFMETKVGIDTSVQTKPAMVSAGQRIINDGLLVCKDSATIQELLAYEQVRSDSGKTTLFQGASGTHDDRVMAILLALYVASTDQTVYDDNFVPEVPKVQHKDPVWRDLHEQWALEKRTEENGW